MSETDFARYRGPVPRSERSRTPNAYVADGQAWLTGELTDDAPVGVHAVHVIATRLDKHMASTGLTARAVERETGVGRRVIDRLLAGEVIPDVGTIARLEKSLGVRLWPATHNRATRGGGGNERKPLS